MSEDKNLPGSAVKDHGMEEYRTLVERCRRLRLESMISNASSNHASILFENLFAAACDIPAGEERAVRLRTHTAAAEFYDRYCTEAKAVMDRGVKVSVLLDDDAALETPNAFLQEVIGHQNGEARAVNSTDPVWRYMIVGNSAYRVEVNADNYEAVANFNDPSLGAFLTHKFNREWIASSQAAA